MLRLLWRRLFKANDDVEELPHQPAKDYSLEITVSSPFGSSASVPAGDNDDAEAPEKITSSRHKEQAFDGNWKESPAHLLLLTQFLRPRSRDDHEWSTGYWDPALGESTEKAIERFLREGTLVPVSTDQALDHGFTVPQLKELLRERGLKVSGRKSELIARLIEADPTGAAEIAAKLNLIHCSELGRDIAERYLAEREKERIRVWQQVRELLKAREFVQASKLVADYEARQVFPRGLNIDWRDHDPSRDVAILKAIFATRPRGLGPISDKALEEFRMYAALDYLWGTNEYSQTIDAVSMILSSAQATVNMADLGDSGARFIEIRTANDDLVCPACRALEGRRFPIDEAPSLPYERCTSEFGCRCWAVESDF